MEPMRSTGPSRVERTKLKILKAAFELMAKNGVAGVTIQDVAKRAKTSHPLVTYHFDDMDLLYIGVLKQILEEMRGATVAVLEMSHPNQKALLKAYTQVLFYWGKKNQAKMRLWIYFYYLASVHDDFRQFNDEIRKVGRARILSILTKGMALGEFPKTDEKGLDDLSINIQALLTGHLIMCLSESGYSFDEAGRIISSQVETLVLGKA